MAVSISVDRLAALKNAMKSFDSSSVVVGIPDKSEKNKRDDTVKTNSEIAFTNEFGEPSENIPARPFLIPGTKNAMEKNGRILIKAVKDVLKLQSDPDQIVENGFDAVGLASQRAVQDVIDDGIDPPLAPYTLAERARQRVGRPMGRMSTKAGLFGDKPLLFTGNLKQSITYLVEK
jgi:hypothetical protein